MELNRKINKLAKPFGLFSLICIASVFSANAEEIATYVCKYCSAAQAKEMAKAKFDKPDCQFGDLNRYSQSVDATPVYCDSIRKNVIILEPHNKVTRKYKVIANNPIDINSTPVGVSSAEHQAAEIFYNFYDDVVVATNQGHLTLSYDEFLSVQQIDIPTARNSSTANSSGLASCAAVSEYMRHSISQSETQDFIRRKISKTLDGIYPGIVNVDPDLKGTTIYISQDALSLGIDWDTKQVPIIATIGDDQNQLVFDVGFRGSIDDTGVDTAYITLSLDRHLSRIDGLSFQDAFPDGVINEAYNSSTQDHQCLRELVDDIAEQASWGEFTGDGFNSSNELTRTTRNGFDYCVRNVSYRTCSSDAEGKICTKSTYSFPVACL